MKAGNFLPPALVSCSAIYQRQVNPSEIRQSRSRPFQTTVPFSFYQDAYWAVVLYKWYNIRCHWPETPAMTICRDLQGTRCKEHGLPKNWFSPPLALPPKSIHRLDFLFRPRSSPESACAFPAAGPKTGGVALWGGLAPVPTADTAIHPTQLTHILRYMT